jgi:hypothetical protein
MAHLSWTRAPSRLVTMTALGMAAAACNRGGEGHGIVGAWRLAALEEGGAGGSPRHVDATGSLILTRDGRMSVHVMYRDMQSQSDAGTVQYAQGGYEASFGRYELDELGHKLHVPRRGRARAVPRRQEPEAPVEIRGPQLVIKPAAADEHWRVVWERY